MTTRAPKGEGSAFSTPTGYRGYVTVGGKRKYFSAKTKLELANKKRVLLNQRDNGQLTTGRSPTVLESIDAWLDSSTHRASTTQGYRFYIDHFIGPGIGHIRLDKLSIDHLTTFYSALGAKGLSGSAVHQCHSILRVALKHATWRGQVSRNVAALIQPPTVRNAKQTTFSEGELASLFHEMEGDRYEARWHLALLQGLRPGESLGLEWADIDFKARTLSVHQQLQHINGVGLILVHSPKTSSGDRTLFLPKYLTKLLKTRRNEQRLEKEHAGKNWKPWHFEDEQRDLIFTQQNGAPTPPRLDATNWYRLLEAAGLPRTRRYTARHTAASMMITNNVDVATVSETLGHASPAFTLSRYVHAVDERKLHMAKRLDTEHERRRINKVQNKVQSTTAQDDRVTE